ncbi:UDP-N-acetylglucosamine 2-epimerase (non-hydrolyzing) [Streptomyces sp. NPDC093990]|uniref:non-hydrolyzing UDP-N-acetylglucosamine 2-epimerase n=1 Tax=Streptomyces sp. NPDC093990 TaxID=3155306 RepID=UPI00342E4C94
MQRRTVALVFGTRPEAIKMAPLIKGFAAREEFRALVVTTGQHTDMVEQALAEFGVEADITLGVRRERHTLAELTGAVLTGVDEVLSRYRPQALLTHGDTTTTLGASLAAFYRMVPLVHVEAGLRSGNRWAPYPEEINRRVTSLVTNLHLAPTPQARDNLLDEGVDPSTVVVTGNTVLDAMHLQLGSADAWADPALDVLDRDPRRMVLLTVHRRESWGTAMSRIARTFAELADRHPEMLIVACVHPNPRVRDALLPALRGRPNIVTVGPQPYSTFLRLIRRAHIVVTDSGGVQEECTGLHTPALVLREVTERQEATATGGVALVGTEPQQVRAAVEALWEDPHRHARMAAAASPFGDGRATGRCIAAVAGLLGLGDGPLSEYEPLLTNEGTPR